LEKHIGPDRLPQGYPGRAQPHSRIVPAVKENESPIMFVMRLKIDDNNISEVESMGVRNSEEGMLFNPGNLKTVSPTMTFVPPASERNAREEMMRMAFFQDLREPDERRKPIVK
jgi:hypothetical protein